MSDDARDFEIVWTSEDVNSLRPDWTDAQCLDWLCHNWRRIEERSVELGWEVMQDLMDSADPNNDEFCCESCRKIFDIENSIKWGDDLFCESCSKRKQKTKAYHKAYYQANF